ncbi:hypothetical protein lb338_phage_132 [Lactobacillus phage Lb338-1]|uniref:Uncharacterized protein n=1 Tax=Lactobacillus phage Lb338-1 TaxID=2892342 RepID=C1KFP2_9CAUD|nr:baseplate protein [Lactobacillus phage Lb338-1]ACO37053.1 hypothetical protein lb338_phage_132 [Lactobacillus phage Lb338-1]
MDFWKYLHPLLKTDNDSRYSTANYAVLKSLADSLSDAESDTLSKKIQLIFETATGDYLDEYGKWFGVSRYPNEDDNDYRERIKYYLLIPRSTVQGIIEGIQYYLNDTKAQISVYEPWKNIFYLNKSNLNGDDHLPGFYYRYAVINVSIDRPMSQAIYDAIQAFKPAGVKFYVTINENLSVDTNPLILADLQAKNMEMVNQIYGFNYKQKIPVTFADRSDTLVAIEDYFKTNNSDLNSKDVLAGSPTHNVTYWNSLKTSNSQYKDVPLNLLVGTTNEVQIATGTDWLISTIGQFLPVKGTQYTASVTISQLDHNLSLQVWEADSSGIRSKNISAVSVSTEGSCYLKFTAPLDDTYSLIQVQLAWTNETDSGTYAWHGAKVETGTASSPWSPNPADPEYYMATDDQRVILSKEDSPYINLPYTSGINMVDGKLSIYNLFINKYRSLLNTYTGSTDYDKVKSLIADVNTTIYVKTYVDNPIVLNGSSIDKGINYAIIDKGTVVYESSDIYVPIEVSGTKDTNFHYIFLSVLIKKPVPGIGMNLISSQMDTSIPKP